MNNSPSNKKDQEPVATLAPTVAGEGSDQRIAVRRNSNVAITVIPVDETNTPVGGLSIGQCLNISKTGLCIALRNPIDSMYLQIESSAQGLGFTNATVKVIWTKWIGDVLEAGCEFVTLPIDE